MSVNFKALSLSFLSNYGSVKIKVNRGRFCIMKGPTFIYAIL